MKKMLIVDDIPQNLYLLEILLTTNGFQVDQAANGSEALEIARKNPPDMIISDILMPVMDGYQLCRIWKSDDRLKNIPFIFYTATYTDLKDRQLALNLGADRFFVKPMEPDEILGLLQEVFDKLENGTTQVQNKPDTEDDNFFREYNEVLIHKLEDKMSQVQESNARLYTLYHTSTILGLTKSVGELIHEVLIALVEKAGYPKVIYYSHDENLDSMVIRDANGFSPDFPVELINRTFRVGEEIGLVGLVAQTRQLINVPYVSNESRWLEPASGIKSGLYIPVYREERTYGVLALFSSNSEAFSEEDEKIISSLANNMAITLENIAGQDMVQKQLQRLSLLHQIDYSINSGSELGVTLDLLVSYIVTQLKIDAVEIQVFDQKTHAWNTAGRAGFSTHPLDPVRMDPYLSDKIFSEGVVIHLPGIPDHFIPPSWKELWSSEGFVAFLGVPIIAKGKVKGIIEIFTRTPLNLKPEWMEFINTLAGQAAIAIENSEIIDGLIHANQELTMAYDATIQGWSQALDLRDKETEGHTQRVAEWAVRFAQKLDIPDSDIMNVRRGALLHDIGKIGVPDNILLKPGPLSAEEWVTMRKHPETALSLLSNILYLKDAIDIPYCHHEKWDGSGYPRGLKGEEIPLVARLFSIIDVWDALSSDRPYRSAWKQDEIFEYIQKNSGTFFDPHLVPAFMELILEKSRKPKTYDSDNLG